MCLTLIVILHLHKVNATTEQCGVCTYFGVKIKGADFLNGQVVMISNDKVLKSKPYIFNYTSR